MSNAMYDKGEGTSGIRGQLYETKLLSLIFYRAKHDDSIEEFQLATNYADIGAFDDICMKVKVKGIAKPLIVCIQAKHKDDSEQTLDIDMMKYFCSYLKIRERFELDNKDELFQGKFQETESYFVIYTSGKDTFGNDSVVGEFASKLNNLIGTGGTAKQPYKNDADVKFLCEILMKEQTTSLAKQVAAFMSGERNFQMMLSDELMLLYHVVLTLKVVDISAIEPGGHRIATFRQDFFDTKEEYLSLFKNTLYKEILKRRKIKKSSEITILLSEFLAEPTDVIKLSKLIETVITYNNGQLKFVRKSTELQTKFKQQLNQVDVSRSTVNEAIDLAAREMLSKGLKVPAGFGNKDLMLSGSDARKARRIKHLTSIIIDLLAKCTSGNIVTVDNSVDSGFLQLNGGIAGAIGNVFVLDNDTKLMKITENWELLGDLAQMLYKDLTDKVQNLHEIRFRFKVNKFPKLSFNCSEYEETLARDFLNKLLFYSKQADEKDVEKIIKDKIEEYQVDHPNYFQAKTDAMFLKYHDAIQKWWMEPKRASYLTKDSYIFENAVSQIIKDPLLSSINITCMSKIKHVIDYTFTEDAVSFWNLLENSSSIIITDNSTLTVVKVVQHLKNKDHAVLDLQYILNLPLKDRHELHKELVNTKNFKVIIFVCDKIQNIRDNSKAKIFENLAEVLLSKKTVIITNSESVQTLQKYFLTADNPVHDKNNLIDMSVQSQKSILETRVMFQGVEVTLDLIVDDKSKTYVKGDILNKIIYSDTIQIGTLNVTRQYNEIKHLYFELKVQKTGPTTNESFKVNTLYDIEDDVVVVTAEAGMGKTILLTHLSLETKKRHPEVWIIRVNLLEYSRELNNWKEKKTDINTLETLEFMCQVILREKLGKKHNVAIALEEQNGVVYLKDCTGDPWIEFELKMFLHFFNDGKMIFLFDGIDEICPYYMNEAMKCIQVINNHLIKHKIWVTSRSYSKIQMLLQGAFGNPYSIEHMSMKQKYEYLKKIWQTNLVIKEFDETQLGHVGAFLHFILLVKACCRLHKFQWSLHEVYVNAWCYLNSEMKVAGHDAFNVEYDFENVSNEILQQLRTVLHVYDKVVRSHTPLHLFLQAHFFINKLKSDHKDFYKWDHYVNTFIFYQQYLETSLKTIRFENKNQRDNYYPDNKEAYEKELVDCVVKHKKLAAYAIFNQENDKLFKEKELEEIKETIKQIEEVGEKTGLICGVANGIPIFIHMTFTEYFAVEYICDLLKNEEECENQIQFIRLIFEVMISICFYDSVKRIIDFKIMMDKNFNSIMKNNIDVIGNLFAEWITQKVGKNARLPVLLLLRETVPNYFSFFIPTIIKFNRFSSSSSMLLDWRLESQS